MPGERALFSYKDPGYDPIEAPVESRLGLPGGLLKRIRTRGERSNADQVSEAGARSVYQITPQTRAAILKKYGVDAYLGPRQSALAAGYVLKEGLDRNSGDERSAVAEYHGGVNRRAWGPRTRAYVSRVSGGSAPAQDTGGQSTYDRVRGRRDTAEQASPSIASVYDAYRGGRMSPQEARDFEQDVENGAIMLPSGGSLKRIRAPEIPTLPASVVQAYNSGQMSDAERGDLDRDVASGVVKLPQGAKLNPQGAQTALQGLALGGRHTLNALGAVLDIPAGAVNSLINALPGEQGLSLTPGRDLAAYASDAMGLPRPSTDAERLTSAIYEGAGVGMTTAGAGLAAAPATSATSATGTVMRALAANPVTDIVANTAGAAGAEIGGRNGGMPGAIAGSLVGAIGGVAASRGATAAAERLARRFPRAEIFDESGALTENGREVIQRSGADVEDVRTQYARQREDTAPRPRGTPDERQARREAVRERLADPDYRARIAERVGAEPSDAGLRRFLGVTDEAPPGPGASAGAALTDEVLSERVQRILRAIDEQFGGDMPPVPPRPPSGGGAGAGGGSSAYDPNPLGEEAGIDAARRFERAQGQEVRLTRGQSEQNFDVQNDENSLRVAANGSGERARQFYTDQQESLKGAVERFRTSFDNPEFTPEQRGAQVKQAISDLRDEGAEGVRRMYREAEALGGNQLTLQTTGIRDMAQGILIDEAVPEAVKRSIAQELARYGIIGKAEPINEAGITRVILDDGSSVQFRGPVKELTVANAEDMRQAVNRLYDPMKPNLSGQELKTAIDDAVEEATASAAATAPETGVGQAYRNARAAYVDQRKTFKAKDVVQRLAEQKRGTDTDLVLDARTVKEILGADPNATTDLRKIKGLLLSSKKPKARAAWRAIQAQGLADIFDKAVDIQSQSISGRRLNTAINKFGVNKLKVLLPPEEFNQLMKLRRVIADATIPMTGTTNPSGTFTKLVNFLSRGALRLTSPIPGLGKASEVAAALASKAQEVAATRKTLQGITSYDGRVATGRRFDQQAQDFISQFISDGKAARLMPAAINIKPQPGPQETRK